MMGYSRVKIEEPLLYSCCVFHWRNILKLANYVFSVSKLYKLNRFFIKNLNNFEIFKLYNDHIYFNLD